LLIVDCRLKKEIAVNNAIETHANGKREATVDGSQIGQGHVMDVPTEPAIVSFSRWCAWHDRHDLQKEGRGPGAGLYLLSRFEIAPDRDVTPSWLDLPVEVFYVGMSKNLHSRPLQDHRDGKRRYRAKFKEDHGYGHLYVSVAPVFPVECSNQLLWYILLQHLETKIAWGYASKHRVPLHVKNQYTVD
jgi:hypothetical protein